MVAGLVAACATAASATIVIETVPVGNPGNAGDSPAGYGAVAYGYNMGKYEVTAGQYTEFLNAVAASDIHGLYNSSMDTTADPRGCNIKRIGSPSAYTYSVAADWANRPVNFVSWGDAARFANWMHNGQPSGAQGFSTTEDGSYFLNGATSIASLQAITRKVNATWTIPSENEWYKSAYHKNDGVTGNYWDYPTGSDGLPSNVLSNPNPDPGNNANFYNNSYTIGSPYYRTEVGDFENSESPYGTFDQGGNVWEWDEAKIGASRGLRGSAFGFTGSLMRAIERAGNAPDTEGSSFGFRIAQIPEPSSLAMLALAGVGVLGRRRSRRQ